MTTDDRPLHFAWPRMQTATGNSFGYTIANQQLLSAFMLDLGESVVLDMTADLEIVFSAPEIYTRHGARVSIAYTMVEGEWVPPWSVAPLRAADALVVPCEWNKAILGEYLDCPIYVVPLGCRAAFLAEDQPVRTRPTTRPFRWLWIGAHNQRKGWMQILDAWKSFQGNPGAHLYLKTTKDAAVDPADLRIGSRTDGNVTLDNRVLSDEQLRSLYHWADGFLLPSWGEGFGCTGLEAMAAGLPVLLTDHHGTSEYAEGVTIPLRLIPVVASQHRTDHTAHLEVMWIPAVPDLVEKMQWTMDHWDRAQALGRRARKRAAQFTWEVAAQRLYRVVRQIAAIHGVRGGGAGHADVEKRWGDPV